MTKTNIYESNWVDMVFEDKNQSYGAFVLRKKNNHYTVLAIILAILAFGLVISAPVIIDYIKGALPQAEKDIVFTDVKTLKEPPPVDEKEPPPPDIPPPPPLKQTLQYTAPVIKPDEEVVEERMILQDSLDNKNLGQRDVEGDTGVPDLKDLEDGPDLTGGGGGEEEPVTFAEQKPEYPGGEENLLKDIKKQLNYPPLAIENKTEGTVRVTFVVEKDGSVTQVSTMGKTLGDGIEEEALRVVRKLPKFSPAKQNGKPVRYKMVVPIKFKLQ